MGETLQRYRVIRVADRTDDQHPPAEIDQALIQSGTQEELQEFFLSQIKRIIFGDAPGTWHSDFQARGILSLLELTAGGQSILAYCQPSDMVGDLVCVAGPSIGGVIQVHRVDITDTTRMPCIGAILEKSAPTECKILRYGILVVPSMIPGKLCFTGADGRPAGVQPVAPSGGKSLIQVIGVAIDPDRILFRPSYNMTRVIP